MIVFSRAAGDAWYQVQIYFVESHGYMIGMYGHLYVFVATGLLSSLYKWHVIIRLWIYSFFLKLWYRLWEIKAPANRSN